MTDVPTHRYLIGPWRRGLIYWIFGPLYLGFAALLIFGDPEARTIGGLLCLFLLPFILWWEWMVRRLRLEFSPAGVRHRQGSRLILEAAWSEVERIRVDPGREGIVVSRPMEGRAADRLASIRGFMLHGCFVYDEEQRQLMAERRLIPIDPFAYLLKNGRLLRDLEAFAPELAAATRTDWEGGRLRPKPAATREEKRRLVWVTLIIAAALALGIFFATADSPVSQAVEAGFFAVANAIASPLMLVVSAVSTWNSFKERNWLLGFLFLFFTLITLGWCFVAAEGVFGLFRGP